ncbi:triacylglycerol lipase [Antrihabitans cavernicola]|uniref:Triacylglycerol lipase n=2 Tax=Antrihabitans cavernicola TaxID=2495913 RepID=A0A5A7SE72_9NOCA|nr:triacylglycerol lipase [Spelaeibacter cavernicola]
MIVGFGAIVVATAPAAVAAPPTDSFYDPPANFASAAPGAILKSRPVTVKALELFPVNVQAWQLLYRTTNSDGSPYAAVTTVMIPQGPAKPRPLLSYQTAYDSTQRECMPSYSLREANPLDLLDSTKQAPWALPPLEFALAAAGLDKGWAVSMPDPGGIDNHFLTPRVMGYTTLDGIRAAQNFAPLGLPGKSTKTAMWGYSGGGIATSWASELQPKYAPELNLAGAAIGAPVPDLATALNTANGRILAGLIPIGVSSISKDSPEFAATIDKYLTPEGRSIMAAAGAQCLNKNVLFNMFRQVSSYITVPLDQLLADPVVKREIAARTRPPAAPTVPMYIYNGVNDEVSSIAGVDKTVAQYCSTGTSVTYTRDGLPDIVSDHTIVALTGAGGAFAWLDRAMSSDQPVNPPGCRTSTVASTLLDQGNLSALPDFVVTTIKMLFGVALGQGR